MTTPAAWRFEYRFWPADEWQTCYSKVRLNGPDVHRRNIVPLYHAQTSGRDEGNEDARRSAAADMVATNGQAVRSVLLPFECTDGNVGEPEQREKTACSQHGDPPVVFGECNELRVAAARCADLLDAVRPRDGHDLAWRCEGAVKGVRRLVVRTVESAPDDFADWLQRCHRAARSDPDAAGPKAAEVLGNVIAAYLSYKGGEL